MKTTRVAIIVPDGLSGRGGIGRVMTYLVRFLAASTSDIKISVHRTRLSEQRFLKHLTVPLALAAFTANCILRRIDVVHINVAPRGSTWRKALYERSARALGKPVILHLHGSGYDDFYAGLSAKRRARARALFGRVASVVALSGYWRQFVVSELGVAEDRVVEIGNGVPAAASRVFKLTSGVPLILFLGVVGQRKGIDVLIDALASPQMSNLAWRAIVGGNGEVEAAAARAHALGIEDRVEFVGWVSEQRVDELLRQADIFVLPSRAENQPVSILEAMARSTPVVATRIGAIPDQVLNGQTGLLVEPGDVAALANALEALVRDPAARSRFGRAGLARFEERFSVDVYASRFADLYRSLRG